MTTRAPRVHVDHYGSSYHCWLSGYAISTQSSYAGGVMDYCRVMAVSIVDLERDGGDFNEYRRRSARWPLAESTIRTRIVAVRSFIRFAAKYNTQRVHGEAA